MLLVDTSVWVDYLGNVSNAHTGWLDRTMGQERIGLTYLILCEVLQGIRNERQVAVARVMLKKFIILDSCGEALAIQSADDYRSLRRRGYTIRRTIDCIIATFCLREGHTLLHRDRDFDVFEEHLGLKVIHP